MFLEKRVQVDVVAYYIACTPTLIDVGPQHKDDENVNPIEHGEFNNAMRTIDARKVGRH